MRSLNVHKCCSYIHSANTSVHPYISSAATLVTNPAITTLAAINPVRHATIPTAKALASYVTISVAIILASCAIISIATIATDA